MSNLKLLVRDAVEDIEAIHITRRAARPWPADLTWNHFSSNPSITVVVLGSG
jgi:hypothetical protein